MKKSYGRNERRSGQLCAAKLLLDAGYDVTGVTLKLFLMVI